VNPFEGSARSFLIFVILVSSRVTTNCTDFNLEQKFSPRNSLARRKEMRTLELDLIGNGPLKTRTTTPITAIHLSPSYNPCQQNSLVSSSCHDPLISSALSRFPLPASGEERYGNPHFINHWECENGSRALPLLGISTATQAAGFHQ